METPQSIQSQQDLESLSQTPSPLSDFNEISKRVFDVKNLTLGGEPIGADMLDILREEAKYFERSQLWEILNASILNEASNLALHQSTNWEHIKYAKALNNWSFFFKNVVHRLSK